MGCYASKITPTKTIDAYLHDAKKRDNKQMRILLLGPGGSGKSTITKQLIDIYGSIALTDDELRLYRQTIIRNLVVNMQRIIESTTKLNDPFCNVQPENKEAASFITSLKEQHILTPEIAEAITSLWKDDGIQKTYEKRANYQLDDSAKFFFDRIPDMASQESYLPNREDILRVRIATIGIVEANFLHDEKNWILVDVGGQKSERRKWIRCFEDSVTAVFFVVSLIGYNQQLFEDEEVNRMDDALALLKDIMHSNKWIRKRPLFLMLNKADMFKEALEKHPLSAKYPDYTGKTVEDATEYIRTKFKNHVELLCNNADDNIAISQIYSTCATDPDSIRNVFEDIKHSVISKNVQQYGII